MNKFKGTPGPWRVVNFQNNDEIHNAEGKCLADSWSYDIGSDTAVSLANATLMASAPDLLEACQKAADNWEALANEFMHTTPLHQRQLTAIAKVRAVIAKSLGESK